MAYDDSEALQPNSTYNLGGYTFELKVQNVHEPGEEDVVSVFAICRGPDGARETVPMDFPAGTTVEGWYVEANETEASVYAQVKIKSGEGEYWSDLETRLEQPVKTVSSFAFELGESVDLGSPGILYQASSGGFYWAVMSTSPGEVSWTFKRSKDAEAETVHTTLSETFTYDEKTAYYAITGSFGGNRNLPDAAYYRSEPDGAAVWTVLYGIPGGEEKTTEALIARFAIDLSTADGGPDGDWDEPGDTGDPSYTLNVYVTGSSSGSNNGTPLEPGQTGGYGNGGTGGNGGGGGAGASTVIIYEFATDKAGTVNQEATAQGPGTGGPGGKGGKGGDGCILIFY